MSVINVVNILTWVVFQRKQRGLGLMSSCNISGIVKHRSGGYGFKLTFHDKATAQHYKDMIYWIVSSDKIIPRVKKGYYDKKERK